MNQPDPDSEPRSQLTSIRTSEYDIEPFHDLVAPGPQTPQPNQAARFIALCSILLGGLLGGLIGYGTTDIMVPDSPVIAALGLLVGAVGCAIGVGIVARLAILAMGEWKMSVHPEAKDQPSTPSDASD